jgi:hypothetical protein
MKKMKKQKSELYLYLGRRDKTGIRILAKMNGDSQNAVRLDNISNLYLPIGWEIQINQIIHDSRMMWEPWLESASSFEDLASKLNKRGYKNLPINGSTELRDSTVSNPLINTSHLPNKTSMLRKKF